MTTSPSEQSATAIATLTAAFESTFTTPGLLRDRDVPAVVLSWPSVPIEIIRAARLRPVIARGSVAPTPAADAHLEPDIFPSRLRSLVEAALTGHVSRAVRIVIPRTSDPDYKCFLYLREFVRLGIASALAPILLFDLLQSHGPDVGGYNAGRIRDLLDELTSVTGRRATLDDVRDEIVRTNANRATARRLLALRRGAPRIKGAEVFPLLGAFWHMAPEDYSVFAGKAADEIERRPPLTGARVVLMGAPVDGTALHDAIESRGAIVVAEVSPWGTGVAGKDVCGDDPIAALAEKYRTDVISPRTPAGSLQDSIARVVDEVDAVVVSLPPDDAVFGWDYPALRGLLEMKRIPHVCLRGDPHRPMLPEDAAQLDKLTQAAFARSEVRIG
jgi:benzoyl-CoA reductase/2-hydroxyglutaryl-CoA dehydratase subunit BcrC/BadD/HgdB